MCQGCDYGMHKHDCAVRRQNTINIISLCRKSLKEKRRKAPQQFDYFVSKQLFLWYFISFHGYKFDVAKGKICQNSMLLIRKPIHFVASLLQYIKVLL